MTLVFQKKDATCQQSSFLSGLLFRIASLLSLPAFVGCLSPTLRPGAGSVELMFQSDDASHCKLVAKIDTGYTSVSTFQDAQVVLRNAAFEMGANAIRIYRFEPNKRGYAEALKCKENNQAKSENPSPRKTQVRPESGETKPKEKNTAKKVTQNPQPKSTEVLLEGETLVKGDFLWQRCGYGQYFAKGTCQGKSAMLDWRAAVKQCQRLDLDGKVWRLPSPDELQGLLLDRKDGKAMIDLRNFPKTEASLYWTNKRYEGSRNVAWTVDFKSGSSFAFGIQNKAYVRCIADRK